MTLGTGTTAQRLRSLSVKHCLCHRHASDYVTVETAATKRRIAPKQTALYCCSTTCTQPNTTCLRHNLSLWALPIVKYFNQPRRFKSRLCFRHQARKAPSLNVHQIRRFPCLKTEAEPAKSKKIMSVSHIPWSEPCNFEPFSYH